LALIVFLIIMFFLSLKSNGFEVKNEKPMEFPHKAIEISPEMFAVLHCESGLNPSVVGDSGDSIGWAQFQKPTWNDFNKRYGTDLDIYNPEHQLIMMKKMFEDGFAWRWSCARILGIK